MDLTLLKNQRNGHKGRVTYFKNQFDNNSDLSIGELQSMLHRLRITYSKFDDVQTNIESLDAEPNVINEREKFDDSYGALESQILNKIVQLECRSKLEFKATSVLMDEQYENVSVNTTQAIKLPEITLPTFDGSELGWLKFRDVFFDLIHNNIKLDCTTKFHYLISCLRDGKAFHLIEALPVTSQNYNVAWQTVFDHFNNEVSIQKLHMKSIYDIKRPVEGSAQSLKLFIDTVLKHINALKNMGVAIDQWDLFLIHHLSEKLDFASHTQVIKSTQENTILQLDEFIEILKKRARVIECVKQVSNVVNTTANVYDTRKKHFVNSKPNRSFVSNEIMCTFCGGNHMLTNCTKFSDSNVGAERRFDFVKKHQLCTNCLSEKHRVFECKSNPCALCALKHNILLHFGKRNTSYTNSPNYTSSERIKSLSSNTLGNQRVNPSRIVQNDAVTTQSHCILDDNSSSTLTVTDNCTTNEQLLNSKVLLATAVIFISDSNGSFMQCRALLDSGSQSNFATERVCQMLGSRKHKVSIPVTGIEQNKIFIRHKVNLTIKSRVSNYVKNLDFLVLPKITGYLPSEPIMIKLNSIPSYIELADPYFFNPDKIDILLGAEIYHEIMRGEKIEIITNFPPFISTEFGYIVSGRVNNIKVDVDKLNESLSNVSRVYLCNVEELNSSIEKFWKLEEFDHTNNFSIEEKMCESHYMEHVTRDSSGRYSVAFPLKTNISQLGESKYRALRQYKAIEQKLISNPKLYTEYSDFMTEYLELGHMQEVENVDQVNNPHNKSYYLPHHSVLKENSATTKLRVVFNASSKTSTNLSLNDCLMVGPTIQQTLFEIVIRFRKHPVAFIGDIAKMYRQIRMHDDQQDLLRIWWRKPSETEIKCFRLRTVTYGTASAPFLAIRTLKQLAIDESAIFPKASTTLLHDFYVDDVLSGAQTIGDAAILKSELISLLERGGFELRKFASNNDQLRSNNEQNELLVSVLGLQWETDSDMFHMSFVKYKNDTECTKRSVLSEIAQLYDPLGLCAPMVFVAKLFMQSLWAVTNLSWDDKLPSNMAEIWNNFKMQVIQLETINVPRCVISPLAKRIELHAFGDASEKGYGCAIYMRTIDRSNNITIRLLCAKSRVAPLKTQTIPRLELCAALLTAQLYHKIVEIINISFSAVHMWSDSEITLIRIKSPPSKFITFVANRISQIQELTSINSWRYIPSAMNPADLVSRGLLPNELKENSLWWNGPEFLYHSEENWPISLNSYVNPDLLELRKSETNLVCVKTDWDLFDKFSSFTKLIRIVATCLRFITNCKLTKENRKYESLQCAEIDLAVVLLIKHIQSQEYSNELQNLRKAKVVPLNSKLKSLSPFQDENQIIRVGGRLNNADISYNSKHPIILPGTHNFTKLLVTDEHKRLLHAGPQALLYNLRLQYWIIGGRNICHNIVRKCVRCFRAKPQTVSQVMGQLPMDRVTPSRPFQVTGIDFCGPFYTLSNIRSKIKTKIYISVFICFATKAVHLEVVSDLSTASFVAALRRFTSRRGKCSQIYSDNATNFIGARLELRELYELFMSEMHQKEIHSYCLNERIEWKTIPPRSPHFGGLWEAAVKSAKFHLKRVMGQSTYTMEEFHTIVVQIEGCLNSRPLSPMSNDPSDLTPLTPGHFLIGQPINAIPDPSLLHLNFNKLSRYQRMQYLLRQFWLRWSKEYVSELQNRRKWLNPTSEVKLGSLVLLYDDNTPPMTWNMGRVIEVHRGKDNHIRVVTLKTSTSVLKRSVAKICVLPVETN